MESVKKLIETLGGKAVLASELGVGFTAVCNWVALDAIPPQYAIPLKRFAARKGTEAPDELFQRVSKSERRNSAKSVAAQ